jgi:hypothetical protein
MDGLVQREIADLAGLTEGTVSRHACKGKYGPGARCGARRLFDEAAVRRMHPRITPEAIAVVKAKRRSKAARRLFTREQLEGALEQLNAEWVAFIFWLARGAAQKGR